MKFSQLWIWTGPVSAAKTEGALTAVKRLVRQKNRNGGENKIILYRPPTSMRKEEGDNEIKTKSGMTFPCEEIDIDKLYEQINLMIEIKNTIPMLDIVWLDEIHFWEDQNLVVDIVHKLRSNGVMVIVSGLGATSEMTPLGTAMGKLLQVADRIHHEQADCDFCGEYGIATRTVHIGLQEKTGDVQLGGVESFRPACPSCWDSLQSLTQEEIGRRLVGGLNK